MPRGVKGSGLSNVKNVRRRGGEDRMPAPSKPMILLEPLQEFLRERLKEYGAPDAELRQRNTFDLIHNLVGRANMARYTLDKDRSYSAIRQMAGFGIGGEADTLWVALTELVDGDVNDVISTIASWATSTVDTGPTNSERGWEAIRQWLAMSQHLTYGGNGTEHPVLPGSTPHETVTLAINKLIVAIETKAETRGVHKGRAEKVEDISALKQQIAQLSEELARANGYIDRVMEDDAKRENTFEIDLDAPKHPAQPDRVPVRRRGPGFSRLPEPGSSHSQVFTGADTMDYIRQQTDRPRPKKWHDR